MSNIKGVPNFKEGDEIIYLKSENTDEYFEGLLPQDLENTKVLEIIKNSKSKDFILTGNDEGFFLNGIKLPLFEALKLFENEISNYADGSLDGIKFTKEIHTKKSWDLWMAYYSLGEDKVVGGVCPDCGKKMYTMLDGDDIDEYSELMSDELEDLDLFNKIWKKADRYHCTNFECRKMMINPLNFEKLKKKNETRKEKEIKKLKDKGWVVKTKDELTENQKVFHIPAEESSIFRTTCGNCGCNSKTNNHSTTLVHEKKKEIIELTYCNNCSHALLSSHGGF